MSQRDQSHRSARPERAEASRDPAAEEPDRVGAARHRALLQRRAELPEAMDKESVQERASAGFKGAGAELPFLDRIQQSFGDHDLAGVRAFVGGAADPVARSLNASAFASGDRVAFRRAPDLHTAAHEAAHLVQQRAGMRLDGGAGKEGDEYERQADAVADLVVRGQSARHLLDRMVGQSQSRGGGPSRYAPVQFLHGDMNARVVDGLGSGGSTVGQELAKKEARGIQLDRNKNNARKVEFENKLAAAVLRNPHTYAAPVHETSAKILDYIEKKEELGIKSAQEQLLLLAGRSNFFGRLVDDVGKEKDVFLARIKEVLRGGGNIPNHILIHHQFWEHIYEKQDWAGNVAQTLLGEAAKHPQFVRHMTEIQVGEGEEARKLNPFDKDQRGRVASSNKEQGGRAEEVFGKDQPVPLVGAATGGSDRGSAADPQHLAKADDKKAAEAGLQQSHTRGVDMWTIDESKAFTQKARLQLDMPIAAGVSGTTADLMGCAQVMGGARTKEAKMQYGLAVLGFLGSAGAHSFHEIMTVVNAAGGHYDEGDYRGCYPAAFEGTGDFQELKAQFPEFLGGGGDEKPEH